MPAAIRLFLYCLLLMSGYVARAQPYSVRSLGTKEGLSQSYVTTLFQDSRGFIWMGTFFGINRYDGHEIKAYTPNLIKPWALQAGHIHHILEDRHGLLWISTQNGMVIMDPHSERFISLHNLTKEVPAAAIRKAIIDKNGKIWFYAELANGTSIYAVQSNARLKESIRNQLKTKPDVSVFHFMLPSYMSGGLNAFLPASDSTIVAFDAQGNHLIIDQIRQTAVSADYDQFAETLSNGVRLIQFPTQQSGTIIMPDHDFKNGFQMEQMHEYQRLPDGRTLVFRFYDNNIYVTGKPGQLGQLPPTNLIGQLPVLHTLDFPTTFSRLIDNNGDLWIGTTGYGVFKIATGTKGFKQRFPNISFYNFTLLPDSTLWPGYLVPDKLVNLKSQQITTPPWQALIPTNSEVKALLLDENNTTLYMVVKPPPPASAVLYAYNLQMKTITALAKNLPIEGDSPPPILKDKHNNLWIAGNRGYIIRYKPANNTIASWNLSYLFPPNISTQLISRHLIEAGDGTLWVSNNVGLIKIEHLNQPEPHVKAFHNFSAKGKIFSNNGMFGICPDPINKHIIWLGTLGGGLANFNTLTEKATYFPYDKQVNSQLVLSITADQRNNLWMTTNQGISVFDPANSQYLRFDNQENVHATSFNASAAITQPSGNILFGNIYGLYILNPNEILNAGVNAKSSSIQFTGITVNDIPADSLLLNQKLAFSSQEFPILSLKHFENNIALTFSTPFAKNPSNQHFQYIVHGLNNQWIQIGNQHTINLAGIPPGQYQLELKVATLDESTPGAILQLTISPPWYLSTYAYICYAILSIVALLGIAAFQRNRLSEKHEAALGKQEMIRLKSLDQFKNKFFAYIAHEFKTPLTIILGINAQLKNASLPEVEKNFLDAIQYEGNNLLGLIDEMIDVTKLQDGSIQLNYQHGDLARFLKLTLETYQPLARLRGILLRFSASPNEINIDFDSTRTRYILNNIVNNAIRHTPSGGSIQVDVLQINQMIQITIADTGEGIIEQDLPFIFEKYYQGAFTEKQEHNFGLGLSFVKDLVDLMKGSISVSSAPGKGTAFSILLPMQQTPIIANTPPDYPEAVPSLYETEHQIPANTRLPLILIVEDNPSILSFLQLSLNNHFSIITAKDGNEGLLTAIREIPDLILSDIVMPVLDGLDMLQQLKKNTLTAHIPIVLLSAKNELSDRLGGQQLGADAYLGKPFHPSELLHTLLNLHTLQQKWKQRYNHILTSQTLAVDVNTDPEIISSTDEFMLSIIHIFEQHYADDTFDVAQLCRQLYISKAQLYRKLSAISSLGAMEMLRDFRLHKAMEIIKNNPQISTAEVAFQTGFKERSYFSTLFKKKFGVSPSGVKKNH
jgi:signal transduction histidine kinase/CheY-like chemotaxis protein/ligand-binding sensor domain-containing protein/AraC-like DNA-binding protein